MLTLILMAMRPAGAEDARKPYYSAAGRPAGIGRYEPMSWGVVGVDLVNPSDEDVEALSVTWFVDEPDLQFGRRIRVPARSRRQAWHPIRAPGDSPVKGRVWQVQSMLFEADDPHETPIPTNAGELRAENLLSMTRGRTVTGLITDAESETELTQLIWAVRQSRADAKQFVVLDPRQYPPSVESLDALDQLVVADDDVLRDVAACAAIRQWLHRGGTMWLMLNRVAPDEMESLIGDELSAAIVDHVELNRVQFQSHDSRGTQNCGDERNFVKPVRMGRFVLDGFRVSHTIDGWPAAAWKDVGRGRLLVTTLESRAWLRPRTAADQFVTSEDDPMVGQLDWVATLPLEEVAFDFCQSRTSAPLAASEMRHAVSEQIGYRIASRRQVGLLLGGACVALVVFGMWLSRRGRLEHFGWAGPLGAALVSLMLLGVGRASREAVGPSVAVMEFAETSSGADEAEVTGLAAVYSPQQSHDALRAMDGGSFWPELIERAGAVKRMISTDRNRWEWQNVVLPAGQHYVPFSASYRLSQPVRVVGAFGPDGVGGVVEAGPFLGLADSVVALPATRHVAAVLDEGGRFTCGPGDVLAADQYVTGTVLSDEQRRHGEVYRLLFAAEEEAPPYPDRPTLLVWASPPDLGFDWLEGATRTGAVLVSVPLEFEAPPPDTHVVVPGPFVPYRAIGAATSVTYNDRTRRWEGPFPQGLDTTLQFRVPPSILPLRVERATLTVDVKAPSRKLSLAGLANGEAIDLDSRRSPLSRQTFEIERSEVLQPDADGTLTFVIKVSDARDDESNQLLDPSEAQTWKIDDVQLELVGVSQPQ